jgi:hypothetical protein
MTILYRIRRKLMKKGHSILERRARKRILLHQELWSLLSDYMAQTQSTGCQFLDYEAIYSQVRQLKPREILECGTGTSTVVLAYALMKNAREDGVMGRVTSMEESPQWFEMAAGLLPDSLRPYVDICLSPTVEDGYTIYRGLRYRDVPPRPFDFVFTDGPSTIAPSDGTRACDFDYLHVVRHSETPVYGLIDNRLTTCYVLQKIFGPDKVRFDAMRKLGYVGPCSKHDLRVISSSSSVALTHSKRIFTPTRFHLIMEPPTSREAQKCSAHEE